MNWVGLLAVRAGLGLALDTAGLVSAIVADNPGDTWPFGLVTAGVTASGLSGVLYARWLEAPQRPVGRRSIVVWLGTAPEALLLVPGIPVALGAAALDAGPLLGDLLFAVVASASASVSLVIHGLATWRWSRTQEGRAPATGEEAACSN